MHEEKSNKHRFVFVENPRAKQIQWTPIAIIECNTIEWLCKKSHFREGHKFAQFAPKKTSTYISDFAFDLTLRDYETARVQHTAGIDIKN